MPTPATRPTQPTKQISPPPPVNNWDWFYFITGPVNDFQNFWRSILAAPVEHIDKLFRQSLMVLAGLAVTPTILNSLKFIFNSPAVSFQNTFLVVLASVLVEGFISVVAYGAKLFAYLFLFELLNPSLSRLETRRLFIGLIVISSLPEIASCFFFQTGGVLTNLLIPTFLFLFIAQGKLERLLVRTKLAPPFGWGKRAGLFLAGVVFVYFAKVAELKWLRIPLANWFVDLIRSVESSGLLR